MAQRLVKNGYMGNCDKCYYSSFDYSESENEYYLCHRFPCTERKRSLDYCGEFAYAEKPLFDCNETAYMA